MDVLSDTLRVVRMTGAVFLDVRLATPWAFESEPPSVIAHYLSLPSDCLALFHVVTHGQGWFCVPGYHPVQALPGDAVVLPHCSTHIASDVYPAALTPAPLHLMLPAQPEPGITPVERGGLGGHGRFICGYLHCDQRFNPLLGALPGLIHLRRAETDGQRRAPRHTAPDARPAPVALIEQGDWLGSSLDHMIEEAQSERPGSGEMLARLSEILFVEVVRRYMRQLEPTDHGWLAGVRDPVVGQTLRLLHAQPQRPWTVGELAGAAAVARSTLAQRFTTLIGETPMRYLASWRIQLAKHLLKASDAPLAEIAQRVGYESEAAFNRAFKRHVGWPPAAWRASGERGASPPEESMVAEAPSA